MLNRESSRRLSVLRYAAASAAVLLLSACGSKSDPLAGSGTPAQPSSAPSSNPASVSSSGSSSASSSPTPEASAMPVAAKAHTDDGAIAFTKYYFETLVNAAYQSGNVQPLVLASDVNCVVCRSTVGDSASFTLHGFKPQGGNVSVDGLKVMSSANSLTSILLNYTQAKLSELNTDGSTAFSLPGVTNSEIEAQLTWDSTAKSWKMRQIVNDPSGPSGGATSSPSASPSS